MRDLYSLAGLGLDEDPDEDQQSPSSGPDLSGLTRGKPTTADPVTTAPVSTDDFEARLKKVEARMRALGYKLVRTSKQRTAEEQQKLYQQGRGTPGKIVTSADGVVVPSRHQTGEAVDYAFEVNGRPSWDEKLPWNELGRLAREEGLEWGGDWVKKGPDDLGPDRPHVQTHRPTPASAPPPSPVGMPAAEYDVAASPLGAIQGYTSTSLADIAQGAPKPASAPAPQAAPEVAAPPTKKDLTMLDLPEGWDTAEERKFDKWYAQTARTYGLDENPDDPEHHYNWRFAYKAKAEPFYLESDKVNPWHWTSEFKTEGHPNEIVGGFSTVTGERVPGTPRMSESELVANGWPPEDAKRLAALPEPAAAPAQPGAQPIVAPPRQEMPPTTYGGGMPTPSYLRPQPPQPPPPAATPTEAQSPAVAAGADLSGLTRGKPLSRDEELRQQRAGTPLADRDVDLEGLTRAQPGKIYPLAHISKQHIESERDRIEAIAKPLEASKADLEGLQKMFDIQKGVYDQARSGLEQMSNEFAAKVDAWEKGPKTDAAAYADLQASGARAAAAEQRVNALVEPLNAMAADMNARTEAFNGAAYDVQKQVKAFATLVWQHNYELAGKPTAPRELHQVLRSSIGSLGQGIMNVSAGFWGATEGLALLAKRSGLDVGGVMSATAEGAKNLANGAVINGQWMVGDIENAGQTERDIYSGIASTTQMLGTMIARMFGMGPFEALIWTMGVPTAGQAVHEGLAEGMDLAPAIIHGVIQGGAEVWTEYIPTTWFLRDLKAGAPFAKLVMHQLVSEGFSEEINTEFQNWESWLSVPSNKDKSWTDFLKEQPSAMLSTLVATISTVGLSTSVAHLVSGTLNRLAGADPEVRAGILAEYLTFTSGLKGTPPADSPDGKRLAELLARAKRAGVTSEDLMAAIDLMKIATTDPATGEEIKPAATPPPAATTGEEHPDKKDLLAEIVQFMTANPNEPHPDSPEGKQLADLMVRAQAANITNSDIAAAMKAAREGPPPVVTPTMPTTPPGPTTLADPATMTISQLGAEYRSLPEGDPRKALLQQEIQKRMAARGGTPTTPTTPTPTPTPTEPPVTTPPEPTKPEPVAPEPFDARKVAETIPLDVEDHPLVEAISALGSMRAIGGLFPIDGFTSGERKAIEDAGIPLDRNETTGTEGYNEERLLELRTALKERREAAKKPAAPAVPSARPTDDEIHQQKRAIYQMFRAHPTATDETAMHMVLNWQEKTNEHGAPMNVWQAPSGQSGLLPAEHRNPFKDGTLIGTLYPQFSTPTGGAPTITPTPEPTATPTPEEREHEQNAREAWFPLTNDERELLQLNLQRKLEQTGKLTIGDVINVSIDGSLVGNKLKTHGIQLLQEVLKARPDIAVAALTPKTAAAAPTTTTTPEPEKPAEAVITDGMTDAEIMAAPKGSLTEAQQDRNLFLRAEAKRLKKEGAAAPPTTTEPTFDVTGKVPPPSRKVAMDAVVNFWIPEIEASIARIEAGEGTGHDQRVVHQAPVIAMRLANFAELGDADRWEKEFVPVDKVRREALDHSMGGQPYFEEFARKEAAHYKPEIEQMKATMAAIQADIDKPVAPTTPTPTPEPEKPELETPAVDVEAYNARVARLKELDAAWDKLWEPYRGGKRPKGGPDSPSETDEGKAIRKEMAELKAANEEAADAAGAPLWRPGLSFSYVDPKTNTILDGLSINIDIANRTVTTAGEKHTDPDIVVPWAAIEEATRRGEEYDAETDRLEAEDAKHLTTEFDREFYRTLRGHRVRELVELRKTGISDADLHAFIGEAFGISGGSSGPNMGWYEHKGGKNPSFSFQTEAERDANDKGTVLKGKKLIDEARRVLRLPQPGKGTPEAAKKTDIVTPTNGQKVGEYDLHNVVFQDDKIKADIFEHVDHRWMYRIFDGAQLVAEGSAGGRLEEAVAAAKKAFDSAVEAREDRETQGEPTQPAGTTSFRSGNQNAINDLEGFIQAGQPVGITAQAGEAVIARVIEYVKAGGKAFVDSGVFGNPDVDFADVFKVYARIVNAVGGHFSPNLSLVMPDKVGDPAATKELQEQWAEEIDWFMDRVNAILPVQVSENLDQDIVDAVKLYPNAIIGLPGNKAAISLEQLQSAMAALEADDEVDTLAGVHFLGIGERNRDFGAFVQAVHAVFPDAEISSDSVRTTALMVTGRPAHTLAGLLTEDRANEAVDRTADVDTTELAGAFYHGDAVGAFEPEELQQIAEAMEWTEARLSDVLAMDADERQAELEKVDGRIIDNAIYQIAKARAVAAARPGARTAAIAVTDAAEPDEADVLELTGALHEGDAIGQHGAFTPREVKFIAAQIGWTDAKLFEVLKLDADGRRDAFETVDSKTLDEAIREVAKARLAKAAGPARPADEEALMAALYHGDALGTFTPAELTRIAEAFGMTDAALVEALKLDEAGRKAAFEAGKYYHGVRAADRIIFQIAHARSAAAYNQEASQARQRGIATLTEGIRSLTTLLQRPTLTEKRRAELEGERADFRTQRDRLIIQEAQLEPVRPTARAEGPRTLTEEQEADLQHANTQRKDREDAGPHDVESYAAEFVATVEYMGTVDRTLFDAYADPLTDAQLEKDLQFFDDALAFAEDGTEMHDILAGPEGERFRRRLEAELNHRHGDQPELPGGFELGVRPVEGAQDEPTEVMFEKKFGLEEDEAEAAKDVLENFALDKDRIVLTRGGTPGEGALTQRTEQRASQLTMARMLSLAPAWLRNGLLYLSTRQPYGAAAQPQTEPLRTDASVLYTQPGVLKEQANIIRQLNQVTEKEAKLGDREVVEAFIARMERNLRWLYTNYKKAWRERAKLWYVGAHQFARKLAKKTGYTLKQVAGVLAVLSPQTDWHQNVALAERLIDLHAKFKAAPNTRFTQKLFDQYRAAARNNWETTLQRIESAGRKQGLSRRKINEKRNAYLLSKEAILADETKRYLNKSWGQLDLNGKAYMLRAYDELNNSNNYRVLLPEGEKGGWAVNDSDGQRTASAWHSFSTIRNGIAILEDGHDEVINRRVGFQHKVRSFYNNISDPWNPNSVTIDTHAVGAGLLEPLGGEAPFVLEVMGGPENRETGISGLNPIIAQAYFNLAADLKILPRELQSVTWEGIKGLFSPEQRRGKGPNGAPARAAAVWAEFRQGKITEGAARARILTIAKRIDEPAWVDQKSRSTLNESQLRRGLEPSGRSRVSARPDDRGAGTGRRAGRTANLDSGRVRAGQARRGVKVLYQEAAPVNARALGRWYYSNVTKALEGWVPKGTKGQLLSYLKKSAGAMEEADTIGLTDWLNAKADDVSITRAEVQNFVQDHTIQVQTITHGGTDIMDDPEVAKAIDVITEAGWYVDDDLVLTPGPNAEYQAIERTDTAGDTFSDEDVPDYVTDAYHVVTAASRDQPALEYAAHQLPGGANAREVLLTLPEVVERAIPKVKVSFDQLRQHDPILADEYHEAIRTYASRQLDRDDLSIELNNLLYAGRHNGLNDDLVKRVLAAFPVEYAQTQARKQARIAANQSNYVSAHFQGSKNILAWLRLNDRIINGKRILFIEEIQSDWHQTGRTEGYRRADDAEVKRAELARIAARFAELKAELAALTHQRLVEKKWSPEQEARHVALVHEHFELGHQKLRLERAPAKVPDAPFKGHGWKKLALKRAMAIAADGGYDGIAWTTGQQQADRYKLSHKIDAITWAPASFDQAREEGSARRITIDVKTGEQVNFEVTSDGKVISYDSRFHKKTLAAVIGKDVAKHILETPNVPGELRGEAMNLGGHGMRGFYDKELPNLANDIVKKHGTKVGRAQIATGSRLEARLDVATHNWIIYDTGKDAVWEQPGVYNGAYFRTKQHTEDNIRKLAPEALDRREDVHYLELPRLLRNEILDHGLPLYQGEKASVEFSDTGKAIIRAMRGADISSAIHELAHVARRFLFDLNVSAANREGISDDDIVTAALWAGATLQDGQWVWSKEAEEKFARGFERYMYDGHAPLKSLQLLFGRMARWLGNIYQTLEGSAIDIEISPEMRQVYDKLISRADTIASREFRGEPAPGETAAAPEMQPETPAEPEEEQGEEEEPEPPEAPAVKLTDDQRKEHARLARLYAQRIRSKPRISTNATVVDSYYDSMADHLKALIADGSLTNELIGSIGDLYDAAQWKRLGYEGETGVAMPSEAQTGMTIHFDIDHNIGAKFPTKPPQDVIDQLHRLGFKWNAKDKIWWSKGASKQVGLLAALQTIRDAGVAPWRRETTVKGRQKAGLAALKRLEVNYGIQSTKHTKAVTIAMTEAEMGRALEAAEADFKAERAASDAKEEAIEAELQKLEDAAVERAKVFAKAGTLVWRAIQRGERMYWDAVAGEAVAIEGAPGDVKFWLYKTPKTDPTWSGKKAWTIIEDATGMVVETGHTKAATIAAATAAVKKVEAGLGLKHYQETWAAKTRQKPLLQKLTTLEDFGEVLRRAGSVKGMYEVLKWAGERGVVGVPNRQEPAWLKRDKSELAMRVRQVVAYLASGEKIDPKDRKSLDKWLKTIQKEHRFGPRRDTPQVLGPTTTPAPRRARTLKEIATDMAYAIDQMERHEANKSDKKANAWRELYGKLNEERAYSPYFSDDAWTAAYHAALIAERAKNNRLTEAPGRLVVAEEPVAPPVTEPETEPPAEPPVTEPETEPEPAPPVAPPPLAPKNQRVTNPTPPVTIDEKQAAIDRERAEIQAEIDKAMAELRTKTEGQTSMGLDPTLVAPVAKILRLYFKLGVLNFREFVLRFQNDYKGRNPRMFDQVLEAAWEYEKDEEVSVEDVLGPPEPEETQTGEEPIVEPEGAPDGHESPTLEGRPEGEPGADTGTSGRPDGTDVPDGERPGAEGQAGARPGEGTGPRRTVSKPKPRQRPGSDPALATSFYRITDADAIGTGTVPERVARNFAAIRIIRQLEDERRPATAEEQQILVKYVGWGGLSRIFEPWKFDSNPETAALKDQWWSKQYHELESLLTREEFARARNSTQNAHYTSPTVIRAMWQAVERLGVTHGSALETSAGIGHFLGLSPDSLRMGGEPGMTWAVVEKDSMSAKILQALYPAAFTQNLPFESSHLPSGHFTVAIGNIPFGNVPVTDELFVVPPYMKTRIHNYFFAKALDKVAEGGLVAFVTSHGTLDAKSVTSQRIREYLGSQADFLGAIRLPYTAFKGNAGTEVVTDIIFLRKRRKGETANHVAPWFGTREAHFYNKNGDMVPQSVNEYMLDHPEMVLGTHTSTGKMREGDQYNVEPTGELADQLAAAIEHLPKNVIDTGLAGPSLDSFRATMPPVGARPYEFRLDDDGKLTQVIDGQLVHVKLDPEDEVRVRGLMRLRVALRDVYDRIAEGASPEALEKAQAALTKTYDAFVKRNGFVTRDENWKLFREDPDVALLLSLEDYDDITEKATKTDIFTTKHVETQKAERTAATPQEALHIALGETGRIDLDRMGELLGKTSEDTATALAAEGLIIDTPTGWMLPAQYLSGNVRVKLAEAQTAAELDTRYDAAVAALREVIPEDLKPYEINARLGVAWIPQSVVTQFIKEHVRAESGFTWTVTYNVGNAKWSIDGSPKAHTSPLATPHYNGKQLLLAALNDHRITIKTYDKALKKKVLNPEATALARARREQLYREFQTWLFTKDPERSAWATRAYNDRFNAYVEPRVNGSYLTFPGLSPIWRERVFAEGAEHQLNAIARILQFGNTLLTHVVGAGKTLEMVAAGMEMRRLGLARKPLYVVPNHLVSQFPRDFLEMYPNAKVLVTATEDLEADRRKRYTARVAAGDYDAVVMPYSVFVRISMSPEAETAYQQELKDEIEAAIIAEWVRIEQEERDSNKRNKGGQRSKPPSIKRLEAIRDRIQKRLDKIANRPKDEMLSFEQLGVDALFVDEAHSFKNLYFHTRQQAAGIPQDNEAQRATDMYLKARYINQLSNNRNVVFATGTPVSNSMAEIFVMQKFLQEALLIRAGIDKFDAWLAQFGTISIKPELDPSGSGVGPRARLADFRNLADLATMFRQMSDVKMIDDLPLLKARRPQLKDDQIESIQIPATDMQVAYLAALAHRADHLDPRDKRTDNMAKITVDGRMSALDMRMIDRRHPDDPGSKIHKVAETIANIYKEYNAVQGTQLVFMDSGTPGAEERAKRPRDYIDLDTGEKKKRPPTEAEANRGIDMYEDLKQKLVAQGVPANEIAFIQDLDLVPEKKRDAARKALFRKVREGKIRVLMGSSGTMGTGMNVQDRLVALHNVDPTYKPSDMEQRNGRILRQGNLFHKADPENFRIRIINYLTVGRGKRFGFDAYMWQLNEAKARIIAQFFKGKVARNLALDLDQVVLTAGEMKAISTGNPLIIDLAKAEAEVFELRLVESGWRQAQMEAGWAAGALEARLPAIQEEYAKTSRTAEALVAREPDTPLTSVLGEKRFTGHKVIGEEVLRLAQELTKEDEDGVPRPLDFGTPHKLGTLRGLTVWLEFKHKKPYLVLRHPADPASKYHGTDSHGKSLALAESLLGVSKEGTTKWRDPVGLLQSLSAKMERLASDAKFLEEDIADKTRELETHQAARDADFEQAGELAAALRRVEELQAALGFDIQDPEDPGTGEGEEPGGEEEEEEEEEDDISADDLSPTARRPRGTSVEEEEDEGTYESDRPVAATQEELDAIRKGLPPPKKAKIPATVEEPGASPSEKVDVHPIEGPEMLEFAQMLLGPDVIKIVRKFRKVGTRGQFMGDSAGHGQIRIHWDLFSKKNIQQLADTLAHEIGHLIDWLPDWTLKRGNLLGRLQALKKFREGWFTDQDGQDISDAVIRQELMALSAKWRPWDRAAADDNFRKYRDSSVELWADAMSVAINNPALLKADAPTFFEQFYKQLDSRPEVKLAYFEIQDILRSSTRTEIIQRRLDRDLQMFKMADTKAIDVLKMREAEKKLTRANFWEYATMWRVRARAHVIDKNAPVRDISDRSKLDPAIDPKYMAEERSYMGGLMQDWTERHIQPIYDGIKNAGLTWEQFGEALFLERVIAGDRQEMGNAKMTSPEVAKEKYALMLSQMTDEQRAALKAQIDHFRTAIRDLSQQAWEIGLVTDKMWAKMDENPAYATFQVIDYIDKEVTWHIRPQTGSLKDIGNPANATFEKMLSTLRAIETQRLRLATWNMLDNNEKTAIQQAREVNVGGRIQLKGPDDRKNWTMVTYYDRGKLRGKYVPTLIGDSLLNLSIGQNNAYIEALRFINSKWFRPIFTTYNPGFQTFNFWRDFWRFWKNIPNMSLGRALRRYVQAMPLARVRAFGLPENPSARHLAAQETLRQAKAARILSVTFNDFNRGRHVEDTVIEDLMGRFGVGDYGPESPKVPIYSQFVAFREWMKNVGDYIETLPKGAGIYEFMDRQGVNDVRELRADTRSFIRRKVGSPDFLAGGTWKPVTNEIFLFSNAILQAWRADYEVATDKTPLEKRAFMGLAGSRRAEFWWKTAMFNIAPKLAMMGAILAAEAGGGDDDKKKGWLRRLAHAIRGISEYDMTNYLSIPVWLDRHGNTVYFRMPQDDAGRLLGGILWKTLQAFRGDRDVITAARQAFDYMAGQTPTLSPTVGLPVDLFNFVGGRNIYDSFRSRLLFTERELEDQNLWRQGSKFLKFEFQQLGGGAFYQFNTNPNQADETPGQVVLGLPGLSNILGRWWKITDYGHIEEDRRLAAQERGKVATAGEDLKGEVAETLREFRSKGGKISDAEIQREAIDIVKRVYPKLEGSEKVERLKDVDKRLRMGMVRASADSTTESVMNARTNGEKLQIILNARKTMSKPEFDQWMEAAIKNRVMSEDLYNLVGKAMASGSR